MYWNPFQHIPSKNLAISPNMPEMNFKIGFLTKSILIASVMVFFFGPVSFGRDGVKLYSKGNNSAWTSPATWSLTENGATAGLVPQNNDTVVIVC